jgi:serine/threonine protein kinase/Flp pilus assembly protein TadD
VLGHGSFGVVYLALGPGAERVALKVLLGADPEAVERFRREAALLRRLDHPGVVRVVDAGLHGDRPYYAMEYCPGGTLRDLIRQGPLAPERAAELIADLARAVDYVHKHGVLHRDLKPANVLIDPDSGRPRLSDFGLARAGAATSLTRTGEGLGTPAYMAPEQFHDAKHATHLVDVYALGVTLYHCLVGRPPFAADRVVDMVRLVQECSPRAPSEVSPDLPFELSDICMRAMAREPRDRHASAGALADALEAWLEGEQAAEASPLRSRAPLVAAAALLVCGVLTAAALLVVRSPASAPPPDVAASPSPSPAAPSPAESRLAATPPPSEPSAPSPNAARPNTSEPAPTSPPDPGPDLAQARAALAEARAADAQPAPFDVVLDSLEQARRLAGDDADLLLQVDLVHLDLLEGRGRWEEALALGARLPEHAFGARLQSAMLLLRQVRKEAFVQALRDLVRDDPQGAAGLVASSWLSAVTGKGHRPDQLQAAQRLEPDHPEAMLMLARLLFQDGRRGEAVRCLETALTRRPNSWELLWTLVTFLQQLRQSEAAVPHLDRLIALGEPHPSYDVLYQRARMELHAGRWGQVVSWIGRALEARPDDAVALMLRALAYARLGREAEAGADWTRAALLGGLETFQQALQQRYRQPQLQELIWARVIEGTRWRPGQVDRALGEALDARVGPLPKACREPLRMALATLAAGEPWDMAQGFWQRALEAAPDSAAVALEHAWALVARSRPEAAAALDRLGKGQRTPAQATRVHLLHVEHARRSGDADRLRALLDEASAAQGADVAYLRALERQLAGDGQGVTDALAQALQADPDHASALALRGRLRLQQGQPLLALADFKRALARTGAVDLEVLQLRERARLRFLSRIGRDAEARASAQELEARFGAGFVDPADLEVR